MSDLRQTNTRTEFPRGGQVDGETFDGDEVHSGSNRGALEEHAREDTTQGPKTRRRNAEIVRGDLT
jgi:hypothetical protein